jgi:hypothetical protein
MLGTAALAAVVSGAEMIGHAAIVPRRSRSAHVVMRALEPGYTGTFLYRNDNFRTGQNLAESILTPSTVTPAQFGLLFTDAIDGAAYAQPLYVPNVSMFGLGAHNVVYVATENDSVYAFDADRPGPALWHTSFINPAKGITAVPASDLGCGDLVPIIGITATPVIDPVAGTLYVVSKVKLSGGKYQQQLHALDITTGSERPNSPVTIAASVPGTAEDAVKGVVFFDPLLQHGRPALTIANGVVYLSFASHCDIQPYHGWILGYDEISLAQTAVFNTSPNGDQAGIWASGCGPGVDTNGDLITITGNGTFDTNTPRINYGDSFIRLTPGGGTMSVTSFFTPLNEFVLDDDDLDMGSGGNLLLPDQPGPNPHLMVGIGKVGTIYLLNRDSMGGFNASTDQMVQELPTAVGAMFGTPAYWQGTVPGVGLQNMIYTIGGADQPKMFVISNGLIQTPPNAASVNYTFGYPGGLPVISANGTTGGILWALETSRWDTAGSSTLYAFDATNLAAKLYDSNQFSADHPGGAVKFTAPTVANGSVYVGTQTQLAVFGLFPGGRSAATPTATPTVSVTTTVTSTPTLTATATASAAGTPTPTASGIATQSATPTATPSPVFATLYANPRSLSFPIQVVGHHSKAANITVRNTAANAAVALGQPTVSKGFVVTSNNCPSMLPAGASCTIAVASAPTVKGKQLGQLQLNSDAMYGVRLIKLKGKGVAPKMRSQPKSLTFGPVATDAASVAQSVTLINDSPAPISFTTAPAATPPFNVTANTCTTIAANGGTCTISVEFAPHKHGKYHGILELHDNAADSPQHIKIFGTSK